MLQINDLFWTFQGEGAHAGRRALFVRMPKCNLKCSWCDTEFDSHRDFSEDAFLSFAKRESGRFAVLTGGEPMMNQQTPQIVTLLRSEGFYIAVETNGTFPPLPGVDWITCSPKRDAAWKVNKHMLSAVDEYKYVVDEDFDFDILKRHDLEPKDVRLSLSPEFGKMQDNLTRIYAFIKQNPRWRISLQTHKWMGVQ